METSSQGSKTITDEGIVKASRESTDVGVEVVDTAGANVGNVHERVAIVDDRAATLKSEVLLADVGRDSHKVGSSRHILGNGLATRGDGQCSGRGQHGNNVDLVRESLPAIRTAHEVVAAAVVGANHGGIRSIAVDTSKSAAVPVDDLVLGDEVVDRGSLGLVGGDERC